MVIGLNPGKSKQAERDHYIKCGPDYRAVTEYWFQITDKGIPFYTKLRRFLNALGVRGPRLWTELVKCESDPSTSGEIPIQTQRTCASEFLVRELALVPNDWVIIAVSAASFRAVSYLIPDRAIIGVPHPGSFGHFDRLLDGTELRPSTLREIELAIERRHATWLKGGQ